MLTDEKQRRNETRESLPFRERRTAVFRTVNCLGIALALSLAAPVVARAEQAAPADQQQVEQLQKELTALREQMAAVQQKIDATKMPADQHQQMMGHMGMMQQGWQGMHGQCCAMNPAGCPTMATPPKQ